MTGAAAPPSPTPPAPGEAGHWLLASAGERWSAVLQHPFFAGAREGSLPASIVDRYFRIEYRFVATAAATTGQAVGLADGLDARRRWAAALDHLLNDQIVWFHDLATRRGLDLDADVAGVRTVGLHRHFAQLGHCGAYAELIGGVLGAEWLYASWCAPGASHSGDLADWIELHRQPAFTDHVVWLLDELERVWPSLAAPARERVAGAFRATLAGEADFHDIT